MAFYCTGCNGTGDIECVQGGDMKCKRNIRCNANPQCDAGEDEAGCTISKLFLFVFLLSLLLLHVLPYMC